jgi:energy-coupling factor transport system ATP-binding protein
VIIIEHKLQQLKEFKPELIVLRNGRKARFNSINEFEADCRQKVQSAQPNFSPETPPEKEPIIAVNGLEWRQAGQPILNDIDLKLFPGEFVGLMGPNGSGKTSLLLAMMGLIQPIVGTRRGFGRDLSHARTSDLVPDIGFIFQNPDHQLFTSSVWDEAVLTLKNLKQLTVENEAEAIAWLERLGLSIDIESHPQRLSYGEKRRLNLAAVILHKPTLLLIDEMLIGQDLVNAHAWMSLLSDYANAGKSVLLVNHHADLTAAYCDRVLFMEAGQIVVDAPTSEAFRQIQNLGYDAFLPSERVGVIYA